MRKVPSVSVVIPAYNHANYIEESIHSVRSQGYPDVEIIVVNDGSPDGTGAILAPCVASHQIRYIEQPNRGAASARNRGLMEATGEFVIFLDDDDLSEDGSIRAQVDELSRLPGHVAVAGCSVTLTDGVLGEPPDFPSADYGPADFIQNGRIISPGQVLFRREALLAVGGFDAEIRLADDWDLYIRISAVGPIRLERKVVLIYRVHSSGASQNYWRHYKAAMRVYRKHWRCDPAFSLSRWLWGNAVLSQPYRDRARGAAARTQGLERLAHGLRAQWCGAAMLPEDLISWVRIYGGRARRRLGLTRRSG